VVSRTLEREENRGEAEAVPVAGGPWVPLCSSWCDVNWSRDGKVMYFDWGSLIGNVRTYAVPIPHGSDLPKFPRSGFQSEKELRAVATRCSRATFLPAPTARATLSAK
jgi:hypothetical protein